MENLILSSFQKESDKATCYLPIYLSCAWKFWGFFYCWSVLFPPLEPAQILPKWAILLAPLLCGRPGAICQSRYEELLEHSWHSWYLLWAIMLESQYDQVEGFLFAKCWLWGLWLFLQYPWIQINSQLRKISWIPHSIEEIFFSGLWLHLGKSLE